MNTIREYYQEKNYPEILHLQEGKGPEDFPDINDIYRIGRALQKSGKPKEALRWFRAYVEGNPIADSYQHYLEALFQDGDMAGVSTILEEMEGKGFTSDYYHAAKYELARLGGASEEDCRDILAEMAKERKVAFYMVTLAILQVKTGQSKEAAKNLKKVCRLFDGDDSADYATGLLDAIEEGQDLPYVGAHPYQAKGFFGDVHVKKVADTSFIYAKKQSEMSASEPGKSLMDILGAAPTKKKKTTQKMDDTVPASVAKSMEGVYGLFGVRDMLSTFFDIMRHEQKRGNDVRCLFSIRGASGMGVSRAVRVVADSIYRMGLLDDSEIFIATYDDIVGTTPDETFNNVQDLFQNAMGKVIHLDHIEEYYSEMPSMGMEAIGYLEKAIRQSAGQRIAVVVTGDGEDYDKLMKAKKRFFDFFKDHVELKPYTAEELRDILDQIALDKGYGIAEMQEGTLLRVIKKKMREPDFDNIHTLERMVEDAKRNLVRRNKQKKIVKEEDRVVLMDEDFETNDLDESDDVQVYLKKLDDMIGLRNVKEEVGKIISMVQMQKKKKELWAKEGKVLNEDLGVLNLLFVGNPGTGKTTVARIIGDIYRCLGVLSKGQLIEVTRKDLVSEYANDTENKTRAKVQEALGGILFIDEAYNLWYGPDDKAGAQCLTELVALMENNRSNLMVIMAGYEQQLDHMILHGNPGMTSRMKTKIHFDDYTQEEMFLIFQNILKSRDDMRLEVGAEPKLREMISVRSAVNDFGNGRGIRNLVEEAVAEQSRRLKAMTDAGEPITKEDFLILRQEDIVPLMHGLEAEQKDIETLLGELRAMTGLRGVKQKVEDLVNMKQIDKLRGQRGTVMAGSGSLHLIFQGPPGTGKTTVARILKDIYKGLGLLRQGQLVEKQASTLTGAYVGEAKNLTEQAIKEALGGILFIDEAYALVDTGSYGKEVVTTLLTGMEDHRDDLMVIIAGYEDKIDEFLDMNDGLRSRFKTRITFDSYTPEEMLEILHQNLKKAGLIVGEGVDEGMLSYFETCGRTDAFGNARGVRNATEMLREKQNNRIYSLVSEKGGENVSDIELQTVTAEDVDAMLESIDAQKKDEETLEECLEKLNSLIGLDSVKQQIADLIRLKQFNLQRVESGQKALDSGFLHMAFLGNAGTGKTTVAEMIGKIYKHLGLLSNGRTHTKQYQDLVGDVVGATAQKTGAAIREAMGGVLFVDEAYTLADSKKGGYGLQAIETILPAMTNYKDFMVILAGYPEPMENLLDTNGGLRSRIPTKIVFEDYTTDELMTIFHKKMERDGLSLGEGVEKIAYAYIDKMSKEKDFGNARGVGNIYIALQKKLANRAMNGNDQVFLAEDFYVLDPSLRNLV